MRILMMTNTFVPQVSGVTNSVLTFADALRERGHQVLVVAPEYEDQPEHEDGVVRLPAIQHFNGSDFSVRLPIPGLLYNHLEKFKPELVHSHHPFLLGDTALRVAANRNLPIVFTHHTMYERYTHYVPGDSEAMKRYVRAMVVGYSNLSHHVIAPSESIQHMLEQRGVTTPITAIPTGIDPDRFSQGDGQQARRAHGFQEDDFVIGYVGRLAPEKNLTVLAQAATRFCRDHDRGRFLVIGKGPSSDAIRHTFDEARLADRLTLTGSLEGQPLTDAYHAMNVFAFASHTETQGMVLAEAMTAGVPVVAVDAPGAREVVEDGVNGRLLAEDDVEAFAQALHQIASLDESDRSTMKAAAVRTAKDFSVERCTDRLAEVYRKLLDHDHEHDGAEDTPWQHALHLIETEWRLWRKRAEAAIKSIQIEEKRD